MVGIFPVQIVCLSERLEKSYRFTYNRQTILRRFRNATQARQVSARGGKGLCENHVNGL
jgi:hypothetical protein